MTARLVFEATLIELNKINAPTLKLYEFNYLFNKAINQHVNKIYNVYDINQQSTDDLRVLKASAFLKPIHTTYNQSLVPQSSRNATYEVVMPDDYLHILNCICVYLVTKTISCYDQGSYIEIPAMRLTADSWSLIVTDVYNRPSPMKPYYYIHNVNMQTDNPTNPYSDTNTFGTDYIDVDKATIEPFGEKAIVNGDNVTIESSYLNYEILIALLNFCDELGLILDSNNILLKCRPLSGKNIIYTIVEDIDICLLSNDHGIYCQINVSDLDKQFMIEVKIPLLIIYTNPNSFTLNLPSGSMPVSTIEKPAGVRHPNPSRVRCEIRYGKDNSIYKLILVNIDYIKAPQHIRLTQEQIDLTEDTSQIMEFPDYINQEIINELVHLVMERSSDPRLATNMLISLSIARPTQQLQQTN